ncbi:hypothetical protein ACP4OV_007646 [Aristida adscensionis]
MAASAPVPDTQASRSPQRLPRAPDSQPAAPPSRLAVAEQQG